MKTTTPEKKDGIRSWVLLAVVGIGAIAVALIVALVMRGDDVGEPVAAEDAFDDDEDGDTDVFDFSGGAPLERSARPSAHGVLASDGELQRLPDRFRARIQLAALGPRPPLLTPEQLVATLQQNRAPLRECVRQAGGFRAMRAGAAAGGTPDGGPRMRPSMRFDIGADGRVVPGTVSLEPAGPEGLSTCVADALLAVQFPPAGGDGAHVELPLGLGRGGGRRRPDGGVGGARDGRGSRGGRGPRGEDRAAGSATVPAVAPP